MVDAEPSRRTTIATPSPLSRYARLTSRARVTVLAAAECRSPLTFFRALRRDGLESPRSSSLAAVLMESAAQGSPGGTKSVVVPEPLVRLVVRGEQAWYRPLSSRAEPLLDALCESLDGERTVDGFALPVAEDLIDPSVPDEERLRAPSVLDAVRALAGLVEDQGSSSAIVPPGVYGAFSHELVDCWEHLPPRSPDPWNEPDINLVFALDSVHYDHLAGEVRVVTRSLKGSDRSGEEQRHRSLVDGLRGPESDGLRAAERQDGSSGLEAEARPDVSDAAFLDGVRTFLDHIERGDIFQGVLSRGLSMRSTAEPLDVYGVLRASNPSPYMFHFDLGDGVLLGASPETSVKVEDGIVEIRPIAGTAPRGFRDDGTFDGELDSRLAVGLLLDTKEQAEHAMLVDLARNDVARVARPGTRRVAAPFSIEKYSHVQHLVTAVQGELAPGLDALHAYRGAANMGTLTGAPKLRAMELIRQIEPFSRGFYGGAVGYFLQDGGFDSCIVIRSLRYGRDGVYETRAGAGIVADSIPERELQETAHKARACRHAVAAAERAS